MSKFMEQQRPSQRGEGLNVGDWNGWNQCIGCDGGGLPDAVLAHRQREPSPVRRTSGRQPGAPGEEVPDVGRKGGAGREVAEERAMERRKLPEPMTGQVCPPLLVLDRPDVGVLPV